jgi:hypothetical protein
MLLQTVDNLAALMIYVCSIERQGKIGKDNKEFLKHLIV